MTGYPDACPSCQPGIPEAAAPAGPVEDVNGGTLASYECASCGTALPKSKRAYCNDTCRRNHREKERAVFRTRVFRMKGYLDPREIATVLRADIKTVRAALAVADMFKGVAL